MFSSNYIWSMSKKSILLFVCSLFILSVFSQAKLLVDFQQKGASVFPSMYGIFFEEINHAGDVGLYAELVKNHSLYAELIQNQGFEEYVFTEFGL